MKPQSVAAMWVAWVSVMLGVLISVATSGGGAPTWLLVLLVAFPAAITIVGRRAAVRRFVSSIHFREGTVARESGRRTETTNGSTPRHERDGGITPAHLRPLAADDWDAVNQICRALPARRVAWLRSNDFDTPWLDAHVRSATDMAPIVAGVCERPLAPDLGAALWSLSEAIEALAAFYADNTFPDRLLVGSEWRFFERDDLDGAEVSEPNGDETDGEPWGGLPVRLHELSAAFADAYDDLRAIAAQYLDPVARGSKSRSAASR